MTPRSVGSSQSTRNVWSGVFFGVGLAGFIDEVVFHQLLHWHHFYDRATPAIGLVSDGLFHAVSWVATVVALLMFADLRRRRAFHRQLWLAGLLIGTGGFQLYDGLVQHKLLRLHQIRYVPEVLVYDVVWNLVAAAVLAAGIALLLRARKGSAD